MGNCNAAKYDDKSKSSSESVPKGNVLHEGSILGLKCFSNVIASASDDKRIAVIDRERLIKQSEYKPLFLSGHTKAVNRLAYLNGHLWSISRDLSIRQWNIASGQSIQTWSDAHTLNIAAIASSPFDTQHVFTGSRDYVVKGWDVETGQVYAEFKAPRNIVTSMVCNQHAESSLVYQGSEDLCIRVWDVRQSSVQPAIHITGFVYFPLCMDIHKDSNYLAAGCKGFDNTGCEVKLLDLRNTSKFVGEYKGHSHDVTGVKFSTLESEEDLLISSSKDGSVYVRDNKRANKEEDCVLASHLTGKNLTSLDVIPSGVNSSSKHEFVVGATDGSMLLMSNDNKVANDIKVEFATAEFFDAAGDGANAE